MKKGIISFKIKFDFIDLAVLCFSFLHQLFSICSLLSSTAVSSKFLQSYALCPKILAKRATIYFFFLKD